MARSVGAVAVVFGLLVAGCGPTSIIPPKPSITPTQEPTTAATPQVTAPPATPVATPSDPAATPSGSTATPTPTEAPFAVTAEWVERTDITGGPSPRQDHTWTEGRDSKMAYLFGGLTEDGPSNELWELNLQTDTWTLLQPSGDPPAPRFGHAATWVATQGRLIVWSGQGSSAFFDDIWAYDPYVDAWTQLPSSGAVPAARYGSCAALGPDGEIWISHGFTEDSGRFSDTRSYNVETGIWTDHTPAGDVPVERCLHDCFWARKAFDYQLVLYGGQTTGVSALGDIWAFDPQSGTWTQGPDQAAPARQLYGMAEAGPLGAVIFGGGTIDGGFLNDGWYLDERTSTLQPLENESPPPARSGATLVNDTLAGRDRFLLFGGMNADGLLDDLWGVNLNFN